MYFLFTFSIAQEAAPTIGHVEDPHLDRVVRGAGDQQRLAGQRPQAAHARGVRVAHLTSQLPLLQVPERDVTRR
jgi:hypothetical protein